MQFKLRNDLKRITDGDGTLNQRSVKLKVSNQNIEGKQNSKLSNGTSFSKSLNLFFTKAKKINTRICHNQNLTK